MFIVDFIYTIFILPLEFFMKFVFEYSYGLFGSYGISLIILSITVSTACLPIYNKADKWQSEERNIKKKILAREKMLRRVYKGQERFAMISFLYKQNGYSHLYVLKSSFGVLLQIPFFFAAYHLLTHINVLSGVSFGIIKDLSAPDELLDLGFIKINILPLLMTAVNLSSTFIYSKELLRKDKIQLYSMAALFLFLLYFSPSALTFYWTLNNVYSLCKNVVEKSSAPRVLCNFLSSILVPLRITTVFKSVFDFSLPAKFYKKNKTKSAVKILILFIAPVCLYCLENLWQLKGSNELSAGKFTCCWLVISTLIICLLEMNRGNPVYALVKSADSFPLRGILFFIAVVSVCWAVFCFAKGFFWPASVVVCTVLFLTALLISSLKEHLIDWYSKIRVSVPLTVVAGITFFALSTLYFPFRIFISDINSFGELNPKEVLYTQFVYFEVICEIFFLILMCLSDNLRKLLGIILVFVSFNSILYSFVITHNYGAMDGFILAKAYKIYKYVNYLYDVLVTVALLFIIYLLFKFRLQRVIYVILCATLMIILPVSAYNYFSGNRNEITEAEREANLRELLSFSKEGKNVVVVMLDMFTGGNIKEIKEFYPEVIDKLDGFVWYEDTVSAGSYTVFGKAPILGGYELHPHYINSLNSKISLEERVNTAWGNFFNKLENLGYDISFVDDDWIDLDLIGKKLIKNENINTSFKLFDKLVNKYKAEHFDKNQFVTLPNITLSLMGLFRTTPFYSQRIIYDSGNWLGTVKNRRSVMYDNTEATWLGILNNLLYFSNADAKNNKFKYFVNIITHVPWSLNENCRTRKISDDELVTLFGNGNPEKEGYVKSHIISEKCALEGLAKWFDWMKQNNVYDNTQIILVSDHGRWDSSQIKQVFKGDYPHALHGLLLVKDFNRHGALEENTKDLMANWDVPSIILKSNNVDTESPWTNQERVRCNVNGSWPRSRHEKNRYNIDSEICVKGTIYKKENWSEVKN